MKNSVTTSLKIKQKHGPVPVSTVKGMVGFAPIYLHNEMGQLITYIESLSSSSIHAEIIHQNAPARGGDKPCNKKRHRGENNVRLAPITSVVAPLKLINGPNGKTCYYDCEWDAPKPCTHNNYWHNDELFFVLSISSRGGKRAKKCVSCQRVFPKRNPAIGEGDLIVS